MDADQLRKLTKKERLRELEQFVLNLMDWHEQSDEEQLYIDLHHRIQQEQRNAKNLGT